MRWELILRINIRIGIHEKNVCVVKWRAVVSKIDLTHKNYIGQQKKFMGEQKFREAEKVREIVSGSEEVGER